MQYTVKKNVPLNRLTFYGVGGKADELWEIDDPEHFGAVWADTITQGIPKLILGKGSNLLLSDKGFRGRVFVLKFDTITWQGNRATVEAGRIFQSFVEDAAGNGFGDITHLSGIPGVLGGFVRGNAGAFGTETQDQLLWVEYLDHQGNLCRLSREESQFDYRESVFKHQPDWCVIRATFEFTQRQETSQALKQAKELMAERWKKYPPGRSGGSVFKNPVPGEVFAGKLLDEAGAKGDRIGNAQISERHANFIVNVDGKATQKDVLCLAQKWRDKIRETKGIELEPEIFICDEYGKKIVF